MAESMTMADDIDTRAAAAATGTGDAARAARGSVAAGEQAPAVKGGATISVAVVLLALLAASVAAFLISSPRAGDGVDNSNGAVGAGGRAAAADGSKRAEPVEHAVGGDVGIPGFNSRLDAFRTWARLTWMKLRQPRSDEPRYDGAADGSAGSVADAAKRSFEMGKETVEQAAASAARATGDAVGKTKETVKRGAASASDDAEL